MAAKKGKRKIDAGDVASNRQASYRYELSDRTEAGMVLLGSEVKSLRDGQANLKDAYASIDDGEVFLHNLHIAPYAPAARENHQPERTRKLLMKRREIDRLGSLLAERGFTLVPTRIYFKDGRAKVELALGRGKDNRDKRRDIKERELKREIDRGVREWSKS